MKYNGDLSTAETAVTWMGVGNRNAGVHHSKRVNSAYLKVWNGQTKLNLNRNSDIANPNYGALRVRWMFLISW